MNRAPQKLTIAALAFVLGFFPAPALAGQRPIPAQKGEPAPPLPASPLDDILKALASFDGGIQSEAYWKLREFVRARKEDPQAKADAEVRLLAFLRSMATTPAKTLVCRELRLVAGEKSIPALQALLFDPALSDPARNVLEKIPGPAAEKVLLDALEKASGTMKTGLMASLGARKSPAAVTALVKYLEGSAMEFVKTAAMALGQVGGRQAAEPLAKALPVLKGDFKTAAASALLDCAEDVLKSGDRASAAGYYDKVLAEGLGPAFVRAATAGKVSAAGDGAPALILDFLKTSDPVVHEAAISKIGDVFAPDAAGPLAGLLPALPEESQVKLLAVLGEARGEAVLAAIRKAASGDSVFVRTAALKALAKAGTPDDVLLLAGRAASARSVEQETARASLGLLKGRPVDEAVIKALEGEANDEVRSELIAAVGERRVFSAKSALVKQMASSSERIRVQAAKTLRTIGTPSDIPALLNLLEKASSDAEREEVETTAAVLAQKIAQPDGRSNVVKARLASERDPAKQAGLVRVLGKIGDESSLPAVRKALREGAPGVVDAAVRALSGWPTAAPVEDVWELVQTSADETHKLLALRGFIRMTALGKYRRPDRAVADLKRASEGARRPDELRLILAALPDFASPEALSLAQSLAANPAVKAEAQAAAELIKKRLTVKR
jgi:HEAT repeat protein